MPEFDQVAYRAGVRARTALLARGWPDHLTWQPEPDVEARLDQLIAARRAAMIYSWKAVTDPAPPEVAQTYHALRLALIDAGLPDRLAEFAADFASLDDLGGMVAVVRWTALPIPKPDMPHTPPA